MWSEFCTAAVIMLLWAADKHLLSKVGGLISSTGRKVGWSAIALYSNWRTNPNDMIKDGYHVDEVFLVESTGDNEFREIDVLRIFRREIVKQTITNRKSMTMRDFIDLCCEPHSNFATFNPDARYELVVKYTFDHKQYIIVYDSADSVTNAIRFPIYTEREIRDRDIKQTGVLTAAQLTAAEDADDGIDVYQHLKKLAGPMENFYADSEYEVKRHHLNYAGLRIPVDSMFIQMLDLWGSPYVIGPDKTVIRLEKA
jgi:hypothetical protein